ncbi:MAG: AtpZ/AtpI family protein [Acidobacteriota bacterium]
MLSDRNDDRSKRDLRGASIGLELAASLVGFTLVGLWIDHTFDSKPWGTLICVACGLVGGFYNFIRSSLKILRRPLVERPSSDRNEPRQDSTTR